MTINSPAAVMWAMYLAVAEKQGADWSALSGTLQNDILKEYIAQKEYIYPPRPSHAAGDRYDRIRRAAHAAIQPDFDQRLSHSRSRLDGHAGAGVHAARRNRVCGMGAASAAWPVDNFAPRLSFFFNAHNDFFEEIAKYRAARDMWAQVMRDRYGARDERSWKLRFHAQTAGCSLTWQQPYNNVVRTALQALAAVLGGANPCTPIRWMKLARCPRKPPRFWLCARSRCWRMKPASLVNRIRLAAARIWKT